MAETKPTQSEIERAKDIWAAASGEHLYTSIRIFAQALADTREQERERCAKIAECVSQVKSDSDNPLGRDVIGPTWKAASEVIATAIRGEP